LSAAPDLFNHNVETVPRLYDRVRPQADFKRSLNVLKWASETTNIPVKSGVMVGLGEEIDELISVFKQLKDAGVTYLTIGQYLAPSKQHYPVQKYYHPDEFIELAESARKIGIPNVFSAPLVRSSYHAGRQYLSQ
jgi:lipoic acid synthetase